MTLLFVQLASSVTGNVITIVALELAAAIIGFLIAWYYAKSVYTPVIKGLEADNTALNKRAGKLTDEISSLDEKVSKLSEKIGKLEIDLAEKDKEIFELSTKPINVGKYVISTAKSGEYYFNLKATNGQTILTSEMYSSRDACTNGIESVMKNCDDDKRFDRKLSSGNNPYFNLKAANGQIIGKSEMYESQAGMENGISSVKRNGITTNIIDETD
jgi:uncharacterized protein YegP (UPF0339 family)